MLMAGKNLLQQNDPLHTVTLQRIIEGIKNSDGELAHRVAQLRTLKMMDENQYRRLKTQLPYLVTSVFSPAIRRKENFAFAYYFMLDLDHVFASGNNIQTIKKQLSIDKRIVLMFLSPSNDGLKLLFQFANKIHDASYYSIFYKQFALRFAAQHQLEGLIDIKTSDVSRCCFLSHDPDIWVNETVELIDSNQYLDKNDINGFDKIQKAIKEETNLQNEKLETLEIPKSKQVAITDDILFRIKARINPLKARKPEKIAFQPAALELIWGKLTLYLLEMEMPIDKITPISYGRQIHVKAGNLWAELNIFYGKRGFSVVPTTKTGSSADLAKVAHDVLLQFFNEQGF